MKKKQKEKYKPEKTIQGYPTNHIRVFCCWETVQTDYKFRYPMAMKELKNNLSIITKDLRFFKCELSAVVELRKLLAGKKDIESLSNFESKKISKNFRIIYEQTTEHSLEEARKVVYEARKERKKTTEKIK